MFPERQQGPHREWKHEVQYLDNIFHKGAAYTVGKFNGDHWLLYITSPAEPIPPSEHLPTYHIARDLDDEDVTPDFTIEILMSHLSPKAREPFFNSGDIDPSNHAIALSEKLGILSFFPKEFTTLDAYSFNPCGYSANALVKWGEQPQLASSAHDEQDASVISGEGYYTIHVTPEEGWSYASFECNVPLDTCQRTESGASTNTKSIPDLITLVQRVVDVFQPGRLSLALFISSKDSVLAGEDHGESAVEAAQRAFRIALTNTFYNNKKDNDGLDGLPNPRRALYIRTDKINYEFGGYDLAFASFEQAD